jgi:hypothetical protein
MIEAFSPQMQVELLDQQRSEMHQVVLSGSGAGFRCVLPACQNHPAAHYRPGPHPRFYQRLG